MSLCSLLILITGAQAAPLSKLGDITITEFQTDTLTVPQYYGEWFEIYNNSGATQDLVGLRFSHSSDDGASWEEFVIDRSLLLGAFDYLVLGVSSNTTSTATNYNGNVPVDFVYLFNDNTGVLFNLSLQQDWLKVYTSGGTLLDELRWNPSWGAVANSAHQVSLNAYRNEWANDFPDNWCPSTVFISGSGMNGSPGVENDYCGTSPGEDRDGDGYTKADGDCRDDDASVHPGAVDAGTGVFYDTDDDCDGTRDDGETDDDADGYTEVNGDCDDDNVNAYPNAREALNQVDDDCNGCIDDLDDDGDDFTECVQYIDADGDGVADDPWFDCNDAANSIYPGAPEIPYDGIDQDCNVFDECDVDSDGYSFVDSINPTLCEGGSASLTDCDDINPSIHPGVEENPSDGVDNDCDGTIDIPDRDGDGFTAEDGDCMDLADADLEGLDDAATLAARSFAIHPGTAEICGDLIDNDCSGFADDLPECANPAARATIQGGGLCGVASAPAGLWLAGLLALTLRNRRS